MAKKKIASLMLIGAAVCLTACGDKTTISDSVEKTEEVNATSNMDENVYEKYEELYDSGNLSDEDTAKLETLNTEASQKIASLGDSFFVCEINSIDFDNNTINYNKVEWLTDEDEDKISELGIADDMPNGYYLYDESKEEENIKFSDSTEFYRLISSFYLLEDDLQNINDIKDSHYFNLYTDNDTVVAIQEVYQP